MTTQYPRTLRAWGLAASIATLLGSGLMPHSAAAFCGFYVTGADASLYANATMVVLMRDGTRTVLSMQNNYQGPPEAFALVIPVPTVLQQEQVKVLPKDVFGKIDTLSAPRLVEYWEADPCQQALARGAVATSAAGPAPQASSGAGGSSASAVRIEAQFEVGEYDVVILSADDSSALDTWLRDNQYNIPAGAEPVLMPYVAAGMKFFVAKVDPARVTFEGDQAALSPLRFHYDTPEFSLPVRLGLLNSQGSQDLIVNILAPKRYELANYPNVTIPTNIRVQNAVRDSFPSFYEALFARTLEQNPGAVVTEYSWASSSCDPCPTPPLGQGELLTLGADVLQDVASSGGSPPSGGAPVMPPWASSTNFTLTRLHARYTKDSLGADLVFQPADGIAGGQGVPDQKGNLNQVVQTGQGDWNSFQGRYVILHPWDKALTCQNPVRGIWGGPPGGGTSTQAPRNGALSGKAPAAGDLPALVAESIPSLSVKATKPVDPLPGLPISTSAQPPSRTPPAAAGNAGAESPSARAASNAAVPGSDMPRARGDNSVCSAAPGEATGSLTPLALLAGVFVFATRARRRRSSQGVR
jgi:hypothetical protein